jgi:hypothetical protein
MPVSVFLALLGLSVLTQASPAQVPISSRRAFPESGTMVQANTDYGVVTGVVHRSTRDSLWLTTPDSSVRGLGRGDIFKLSTYGKQYSRGAKRGAVVGALVGLAAVGTSIWLDTRGEGECICVPLTYVVAPAALTLPIIGAGIGAIGAPMGWRNPVYY